MLISIIRAQQNGGRMTVTNSYEIMYASYVNKGEGTGKCKCVVG